jgi:hypothetical protein
MQPVFDAAISAGPAAASTAVLGEGQKVAHVFGLACQRHSLDASEAQRVWSYVPGELTRLSRERQRALGTVARSAKSAADAAAKAERRLQKAMGG